MRVCVCLRQVPDPRARLELRADGRGLRDEDVTWVTDEGDECALEEALRLAGADGAGEVTALTLGPERVVETLRRALALGARRAIHLRAEVPADPRRTAGALADAIRGAGCELVVTGAQSSDLGWGLTGALVAAELGWPHVWLVVGAVPERAADGRVTSLRVTRELERRRREVARVPLPAVLCVQTGLHPPRMPRIRDLLEAKRRPIETWEANAGDAGAADGLELVSLAAPVAAGATLFVGEPAAAARELVRRLRRDGVLPEAP